MKAKTKEKNIKETKKINAKNRAVICFSYNIQLNYKTHIYVRDKIKLR